MSTSAYQQSTAHLTKNLPKYTRAEALARVHGPATGLIAVSSLFIGAVFLVGLWYAASETAKMMSAEPEYTLPVKGESAELRRERERLERMQQSERNFITFALVSITVLISVVCSSVVLAGGIKMRQLKSYRFAYAAAAFATIPVLSPLLVLGIPFGVWALVIIQDKEIKRYFS